MSLESISADVLEECAEACSRYPAMRSPHEGYAILLEEVDELWELVRVKQLQHDYVAMRREAIQIAAMAMRFVHDLCGGSP